MEEKTGQKKVQSVTDQELCKLCGKFKETVQQLLAGCQKVAGTGYIKLYDSALKVIAEQCREENPT